MVMTDHRFILHQRPLDQRDVGCSTMLQADSEGSRGRRGVISDASIAHSPPPFSASVLVCPEDWKRLIVCDWRKLLGSPPELPSQSIRRSQLSATHSHGSPSPDSPISPRTFVPFQLQRSIYGEHGRVDSLQPRRFPPLEQKMQPFPTFVHRSQGRIRRLHSKITPRNVSIKKPGCRDDSNVSMSGRARVTTCPCT